ncbi:MAG: DinB family protein [Pseudomonadota bacterium]
MISPHYVSLMARYNLWQNRWIYASADTLPDAQRRQNGGAFFGSLHTTLAHILWGDRVWMNRFAKTPPAAPEDHQGRGEAYADWTKLKSERAAFDQQISSWASSVTKPWLASDFTWSNIAGTRTATMPAWKLVTHFFNHQTHHRGQAHALLTKLGATTEDTDLFLIPRQP